MMQQRLNIYPNTPPHDFSLRTKDIEGARNKQIERKELMDRLRSGDQNIMFSQGATNKLQLQYGQNDIQQLKSDYNYLKQQVDQLNSTIKQTPNGGQQGRYSQGGQNGSNYQQLNSNNYNPNRYSGNSDNKINVYRNAGSQIINNQSSVFPRNQSQGSLPNASAVYENRPRLGSQEMLNRITSPLQYNQNVRSEQNLNIPSPQALQQNQQSNNVNRFTGDTNNNQRLSPQNYNGGGMQNKPNFLANGYNENQLRDQSIFQMSSLINKYERHRYVPPQKNEFSRFPSKQVFFY